MSTSWCAVLGDPIDHSLSPVLHTTAYAELGLDWEYRRFRVGETELDGFLAEARPGLRGLSLTMPLKRRAYEIGVAGAGVGEAALRVGVANTLLPTPNGLRAENTDVPGLVSVLREVRPGHALVLGAGATATALLAALADLGVRQVTVAARTPARAEKLDGPARELGLELTVVPLSSAEALARHEPVDVVASTLPGGAADPYAEVAAGLAPIVFDAAYEPWPTRLTRAAHEAGARVVDGLDLLIAQAVVQVELMTGLDVTEDVVAAMAAAGRACVRSPDSAGG